MPARPNPRSRSPFVRRTLRVIGWAVGVPLATFRFLRRATPIVGVGNSGDESTLADSNGPAHDGDARSPGPVVHRTYTASVEEPRLTAAQLLAVIAADPNVIAPSEVLRFERSGGPGELREGDEVLIRMAGPWDGPVVVTRRWEEGFRLSARRGHPLLGEVELRVRDEGGGIALHIETRERPAGLGLRLLHRAGVLGRMQSHMWTEMLENAAQLAGGRRLEQIMMSIEPPHGPRPHRGTAPVTDRGRAHRKNTVSP